MRVKKKSKGYWEVQRTVGPGQIEMWKPELAFLFQSNALMSLRMTLVSIGAGLIEVLLLLFKLLRLFLSVEDFFFFFLASRNTLILSSQSFLLIYVSFSFN